MRLQSDTPQADHVEVHRMLTFIGELLSSLAQEHHLLLRRQVEIWRWDEPAATLTWTTGPQSGERPIERNIRSVVDGRPHDIRLVVEANAWQDVDGQRRWHHAMIEDLAVEGYSDLLAKRDVVRSKLDRAYALIEECTESDLTRHNPLSAYPGSPNTVGNPESASVANGGLDRGVGAGGSASSRS